jgi:hypothetical protein
MSFTWPEVAQAGERGAKQATRSREQCPYKCICDVNLVGVCISANRLVNLCRAAEQGCCVNTNDHFAAVYIGLLEMT